MSKRTSGDISNVLEVANPNDLADGCDDTELSEGSKKPITDENKCKQKKAKKSTSKPAPRGCGEPGCTGSVFSDITLKCVECRDVVCCGRYEECCSCDAVMHAECAPGDDLCSNCNGGGSSSMGGWY
mmetsp:Transcript_4242/g.7922  ORF Transcript_4242/g.7922 Transcript_4242/m.7922 type:complete len:127 (-) Transcript_4242:208-588(-)